ncbi:MAG: hypothetical protein IPP88_04015 [Betaproteobacteria bacterium]|nr:hypothetical protein [Betaproteobacteria bacterium]
MMPLPALTQRQRLAMIFVSTTLFLVGSVLSVLILLYEKKNTHLAFLPINIASVLQVLFWWTSYVSRTSMASSAICLQLVPGFRHRVITNTLLVFAGLSAVLAAIFAGAHAILPLVWIATLCLMLRSHSARRMVFAVGGILGMFAVFGWPGLDLTAINRPVSAAGVTHAVLLWGAAASLIGLLGVSILHRWLGSALSFAYVATLFAGAQVPGFALIAKLHAGSFSASPNYALGMALVAAFLLGLTVMILAGQRGDRAIAYFKRNADMRAATAALSEPGTKLNWPRSSRQSGINTFFFDRAVTGIGTPRRLMPFCFGPGLHWAGFANVCLFGGAISLVLPLFAVLGKSSSMAAFLPYMPFAVLLALLAIPSIILRTRREQSLLSLTPNGRQAS